MKSDHTPAGDAFGEKISLGKNIILGLQHLLVMCPGTIAVPLIMASALELDAETTAFLISANFLTSGILTLIHVLGIGSHVGAKLPIILGSSFAPLAPMIVIGQNYGLAAVFGSIIASAIAIFILTFFMDKVLVLFPRNVIGCFVALMGISLAPTAIRDLAGGPGAADFGSVENIILGTLVMVSILLMQRFGNSFISAFSLLIGIVAGTVIGSFFGMVNFASVEQAKWFQMVTPFRFGAPEFKLVPIALMTVFCIINIIQCIGVYSVLDEISGTETPNEQRINGIRAQSIGQMISGVFNSVPSTMFNENISLLDLTKVKSRSVIVTSGIMMIALGIFPKFSAVVTMVPKSVLGGVTLVLFGIITASGISMLSGLDFSKDNNFTIVGTSLAIGVGGNFASEIFTQLPSTLSMILSNGLFMVSISAILLNLLFNGKKGLSRKSLSD